MASQGMTALANFTVATAQATVTFSNIPATFRDLRLVVAGTTSGGGNFYARFNGDSASNYSYVAMGGDGATASSSSATSTSSVLQVYTAFYTRSGVLSADIMDYSATDKHKTVLIRSGQVDFGTEAVVNRWASTAAVTTILLTANSVTFSPGTVFTLYGVSA